MSTSQVLMLAKQTLWTSLEIALPLLALAFFVGIVIGVIQVATSLQDPAFSTLPKLVVFAVGAVAVLPWMVNRLMEFSIQMLGNFDRYVR